MKQFFIVLKFELENYFKNKSFIVVTLFLAIVAAGAIIIPGFFMKGSDKNSADQELIGISDENDSLWDMEALKAQMPDYEFKSYESGDALREAVEQEEITAGFVVESMEHYRYIVMNKEVFGAIEGTFSEVFRLQYQQRYLSEKGMNPEEIAAVSMPQIQADTEVLGKDSANNYFYTYILVFVSYFMVLFYGQMIATSVTSEKSNRAIEILVTSVNSSSLIFGKVLAGAISSVVQLGLILGSALAAYHFFGDAWEGKLDFIFQIPAVVWVAFIFFGMLGYLLYSFIYGMLGALVSKTEDISKTASPITMVYLASFMIAVIGLSNSDGILTRVCSFIPFTSSNSMFIRIAMGSVQWWEILLSGGLLLATCIGVALLAAKIFRYGTLLYGNPIKFTQAFKNLKHQDKA